CEVVYQWKGDSMPRSRVKSDLVKFDSQFRKLGLHFKVEDVVIPGPYFSKFDSMVDELNRGGQNPVTHYKIRGSPTFFWDSVWGTIVTNGPCPIPVTPEEILKVVPLPPQEVVDAQLKSWLDDCTVTMPSQVGLANFIWELKAGLKECLPELKDLTGKASSAGLKYKFGFRPFVSDCKKILKVWGYFTKRMKFLHDTQGQCFSIRRSTDELWNPGPQMWIRPTPVVSDVHTTDDLSYRVELEPDSYLCKMRATAFIANELQSLDNFWDQADAFGHALGLNNLARILYNARAYTWMLDWAVDSDKILDQMEGEPFNGKLHLQGGFHSIKVKALVKVYAMSDGSDWGPHTSYVVSIYQRTPSVGYTDNSRLIHFDQLLNTDHATTIAMLLDQRWRQRPVLDIRKLFHGKP
ncbi:maturation protein, partial [ssRNA phage ESE016]